MRSDLFKLCARMLMVGFPGPTTDDGLKRMLTRGVFGAILFKRNIGTPEETAQLCAEIRAAAPGRVLSSTLGS